MEQARQRLERNPDDVEALNVVALAALRDGKPDGAVAFLERALRLKPDLYLSRLHLAALLERSGDERAGILQFARALHDAQARGSWLNAATTPVGLRKLVEHAARRVRAWRRTLLFGIPETLAERYGRASMARVEECLRAYLGEAPAARPDPRQQPSFLYFPGLPASAYLDRALFPWIEAFESRTAAIRGELLRLLPSAAGSERVFTSDELERQNLRGSGPAPGWDGYYFYRHGARRDENHSACPATSTAIDGLPLARVRGHGPEVLFSVFKPGTHLLPHRGVTNTRVVGHLPLIVPENCALNVGGELHAWQPGRVVVFDDTYEHEAWNRSGEPRVVLIFDIWNPHLTEAERAAVADIVDAIGSFRESVERL
jgi:aspartate beta-hydroxylase